MSKYKTLYSVEPSIPGLVNDLKQQLKGFDAKAILFFASSHYNPALLSSELTKTFDDIEVFGCSTSGEIVTGKMLDNSVVAMAFSKEMIKNIKVEVVTNIKSSADGVKNAFNEFHKHFTIAPHQMDPNEFIGLVLIDGVSNREEVINDKIGNLTNVSFIGGSAGDDLKFEATYVYANGHAYSEAALLVLMQPNVPFHVLKTQSFSATDKILKVTACDEENRTVMEFNHMPATKAYAEALGVKESELSDFLFKNPLGLMFNGEPFVRSPKVIKDASIIFYCSVKEGMELTLLHSTNIIEDTTSALKKEIKLLGGISAIIHFNCILRTLDLKQQNKTVEYGDIFKEVPTVGFSTYGESYIGHINQTATMVLFSE